LSAYPFTWNKDLEVILNIEVNAGNFTSGLAKIMSYAFFKLPYVKGSSRVYRMIFNVLPKRNTTLKHILGFRWLVLSGESLWTYIVSCEKYTTKILFNELITARTFICVGANFGWYPLVAASFGTNINIVGFECNSKVRDVFVRNVELNSFDIHVSNFAISDSEGILNLYKPKISNDGMSTLFPKDKSVAEVDFVEEVKTTTLDIYFKNEMNESGKIVILMDIEGSEMRALKGAIKLFSEEKPVLIAEINPAMLLASGHDYLELFRYLSLLEYESFWIDERGKLVNVKDPINLPHLKLLPVGSGANYLFRPRQNKVNEI